MRRLAITLQVDVDELAGASLQVPEGFKAGESMLLKTSDGACNQRDIRNQGPQLCILLYTYSALSTSNRRDTGCMYERVRCIVMFAARRVTRRLTCISTKMEDTVADVPSTPAKVKKTNKEKGKDTEAHKSARKSEKKKKKSKEDDESDDEARSHKKTKKKSRKDKE
eukprot:9498068-Pyramimonas_sp.AAC.1